MVAVFPQIDALPSPELQTALADGDGHRRAQQAGLDMGGHIVRAFQAVDIMGGAVRDQLAQMGFQIAAHAGVGVFVEGEGGRGVLDEEMGQADPEPPDFRGLGQQFLGDEVESTGPGFQDDGFLQPHNRFDTGCLRFHAEKTTSPPGMQARPRLPPVGAASGPRRGPFRRWPS